MTTQHVLLTQTLRGVPPVVYAVQNDTGRVLQMTIDNGLPVDLTGATAELTFIRSDGTSYGVPCTTDQSIESTFNANIEQAITQPGPTKCQLKVSKNGELVSTFHFVIIVESDTSGTPTEQQSWNIEEAIAAAAEAKATADQVLEELGPISQIDERLTDVEEELPQKANTDGAYEQMTVGNAEQLVSTTFVEDKVPYLFRTSGGSSDIGDREYDKIVGGTVAWNQLIQNGDFETADGWGAYGDGTLSVAGNVATVSFDAGTKPRLVRQLAEPIVAGHKYLIRFDVTSSQAFRISAGFATMSEGGTNSAYVQLSATKQTAALIYSTASTVTLNHFFIGLPNVYSTVTPAAGDLKIQNVNVIDLTKLFGTIIADHLYSLDQATPGAGVAKVKEWGFFRKDYYEYDAGTLKSVEGLVSHDTVGFNALPVAPSYIVQNVALDKTKAVKVIPNQQYQLTLDGIGTATTWRVALAVFGIDETRVTDTSIFSQQTGGLYYNTANNFFLQGDDGRNKSYTFTFAKECYVIFMFGFGNTTSAMEMQNPCFHLVWSGARNGEYEPYVKHSYPLDSSVILRGITKLDENGEMYYDGDTYEPDGTITRRFAEVDLGTLNWAYRSSDGLMYAVVTGMKSPSQVAENNTGIISTKYIADSQLSLNGNSMTDKSMLRYSNSRLFVKDTAYTDAATFKTAMSGVYLVYELATPTTETAEPFADPQIVNDWGTEEYVTDSIIPVGHETRYTNNLRDKLQHLPDLAGSDGDYIVRQTGSQMYLIPYGEVKELPDAPETNGTYRLQLTVSGGTPTLAWVAE